jgi:hypothetical protein
MLQIVGLGRGKPFYDDLNKLAPNWLKYCPGSHKNFLRVGVDC